MDADEDLQLWAKRFHLTPSTVQALLDKGFTSTQILEVLTSKEIDKQLTDILPAQSLLLKRAVKSLQVQELSSSSTQLDPIGYSDVSRGSSASPSVEDQTVRRKAHYTEDLSATGVKDGHMSHSNVAGINYGTQSIQAPSTNVPGTLGEKTLKLRISEAIKTFIRTKSFNDVTRKLDQYWHVSICGASGEGKTTMALMLAEDYMKKGYEAVFVEQVDVFHLNTCLNSTHKCFLILDDIFGSVGLTTDTSHLRNLLDSLKTHIQDCKQGSAKSQSAHRNRKDTHDQATKSQEQQSQQKESKDIRVVFTSKTYNFKDGLSRLQLQRLSMLTEETVVDLTNKDYCYTDEEKIRIFEKHKVQHPKIEVNEVSNKDILNLDSALFGFPLTCRLFFEFGTFSGFAKDFFRRPLFYLRIELNDLLNLNNNQSAALTLMLLCEDKLDLASMELPGRDQTMDQMMKQVTDNFPSVHRKGITTAARTFRGTFFSRGDILKFAHPSICDACACAMFNLNPSFVLQYCSYGFLYERLKAGRVEETRATDDHFLFVSESYYDLISTRLVEAIKQGLFSKTVTHSILQNEQFAKLFIQKLRSASALVSVNDTHWIRQIDKEKGILFWAVQGYCDTLVYELESIFAIRLTNSEITEALVGCVEKDNLMHLKFLLSKLEADFRISTLGILLLSSGKSGCWEMAEYLLKEGAELSASDRDKKNYIHIVCQSVRPDILKSFISQIGVLITREDYLSALNSLDTDGRTPAIVAAEWESWDCLELILKDSNLDLKDVYGNSIINRAAWYGNRDIIQHVLTLSNINSRGRHGWTPVMNAAGNGQQRVFDFLVSNNADLTLVDNSGDSLLHLACQGGNRDIVQHVLTTSNINSRGVYGWTPVMNAAVNGQKSMFDFLVSNNADLTLVDDDGDSLLHLACQGGNRDIVQHVLTPSNINSRGEHGWTPVMNAANSGQQSVFDFLVSNNADLTLVDKVGDSLLHLACQGGNRGIVQQVLTQSNINSRGMHGWTPVMNAAYSGQQRVFDFLVSNNADLTLVDKNGDSLLHRACQGGNRDIIQQVLTPSNINSRGMHGWTPVMRAALNGQKGVFDFLVSNNADLTLVDKSGDSLLHLACRGGNRDIIQHILTTSNINSRGVYGWTPVMKAAYTGQHSVFNFLVSNNADLTLVDEDGDSLLHLACQGGNRDIVQHVLTPSNINSRGMQGWTPVMKAAVSGQQRVFDFLVSNNADLTLVNKNGDSLLHLVCQGGNRDIVQHVLTPSNINSRGRYGWTPVMNAAVSGQQSVFDFLVSNNADLTLVDEDGDSLLHLACRGGNRDIVQHVLTPSNINSRGMHDGTPVMKAAVNGQQRVFDILVSNNADLTLVDEDGDSLLHLACRGGNRDIVQQVLTPSNINSRGMHDWTPVMNAAVSGQQRVFDFLVSNDADITLVDKVGDSLLHLACRGGNRDIVQHVLTPSNINSRGMHDWTPVMKAAVNGQQRVFDFLVSNNADLTFVDENGDSLLHLACRGGNIDIVQYVLTTSNINSRGVYGWTPVMNAAYSGQRRVFDFLVSHNADLTLVDENGDSLQYLARRGGNRDIVQHVRLTSKVGGCMTGHQ